MLCKNCGAQLDDDALFCPKCGASVEIEHADSLGIKEDIPDESAQQKKQNKAISDTGKTFDVAPSVDELEKQKRTTKMMASCAVITLIVACLFIFIGNPTLKTNKSSKNQNIEEITVHPFNNIKTTSSNIYTLKKDLKIFDKSIYDNLFLPQIRNRGERYFDQDKITNYINNDNNYKCTVQGTTNYETTISLR